ncbi:unnamed protein product, partial [Prorocentrum cordatum]
MSPPVSRSPPDVASRFLRPTHALAQAREVCALMTGEIVYAWRCCLGIGRVREVRGPGAAGLDLDALREELCVWGLGLRSTMLFDNSIPFQLTANIVQCRSAALRAVLQEAFEMLQAFHASLGERRHFASPFEVIHRWALATAPGLPVVMLGGHRPIVEFVERHKEDLACTTVSGCRKRADSTYGKALPFGRYRTLRATLRGWWIQLTRLQTFMQQHAGQICASLNYDPNVEMFAGERSYFRCFKDGKRELALLMHGALSSSTGLRRRGGRRGRPPRRGGLAAAPRGVGAPPREAGGAPRRAAEPRGPRRERGGAPARGGRSGVRGVAREVLALRVGPGAAPSARRPRPRGRPPAAGGPRRGPARAREGLGDLRAAARGGSGAPGAGRGG